MPRSSRANTAAVEEDVPEPTLPRPNHHARKRELKLKPSLFSDERNQGKKKLGVLVKLMGKPRLVLRFIWREKNIGIAIDQVIPGGRRIIPKRELKLKPWPFSASSSSSITEESSSNSNERNQGKKKMGVVVKPMGIPRLVLRFIWMEKNIRIAIDQVIPGGYGTIPLSPYYFWPKKDNWEELKVTLETKHWISYKQMVTLLNHASDIITFWQYSYGN
ncbi:hypothetical protein ACS0TY_027185 [Phlomoides rotata]